MSPDSAASILGIAVDASRDEIEAAYKRRARASHPDRFAGAEPTDIATASAEFVQIADARESMLRSVVTRQAGSPTRSYVRADGRTVFVAPADFETAPPRRSWWVFGVWAAILLGALIISALDDTGPLAVLDVGLRLVPLGVCAIAFALTGARGWLIGMIALTAATIVITIAIIGFGPLLSLEVLLVPLLGLGALGLRQRRLRRLIARNQ